MSGHTPGPWVVDPDTRPGMEWNSHIIDSQGLRICFMANGGGDEDAQAECEANARLISAAPDLLEALRAVVAVAVADRKTAEFDCARAAIAKAEGRTP